MSKDNRSAENMAEWVVRAKCVITKEFIVRGSRAEAQAMTADVLSSQELETRHDVGILTNSPRMFSVVPSRVYPESTTT